MYNLPSIPAYIKPNANRKAFGFQPGKLSTLIEGTLYNPAETSWALIQRGPRSFTVLASWGKTSWMSGQTWAEVGSDVALADTQSSRKVKGKLVAWVWTQSTTRI